MGDCARCHQETRLLAAPCREPAQGAAPSPPSRKHLRETHVSSARVRRVELLDFLCHVLPLIWGNPWVGCALSPRPPSSPWNEVGGHGPSQKAVLTFRDSLDGYRQARTFWAVRGCLCAGWVDKGVVGSFFPNEGPSSDSWKGNGQERPAPRLLRVPPLVVKGRSGREAEARAPGNEVERPSPLFSGGGGGVSGRFMNL